MKEANLDHGLPTSVDAERAILGAILINNAALRQANGLISAEAFSLDAHRRLFTRMEELSAEGRSIDWITLNEKLSDSGEIHSVGGVAYITSLTDGVPRRPSIEQYVSIVREKHALRSLVIACNATIESACGLGVRAGDLIGALREAALRAEDLGEAPSTRELFRPGLDFLNAAETSIDWLVKGVIQRGANGFFAAQPKGGKSWAAADLALSLAIGCPWLGFDIPQPAKVALISREDNSRLTQWRMKRLLAGKPWESATIGRLQENLLINTREQSRELMLDNKRHMVELMQQLRKHQPEFVIFDVFNCLHAADENSNEEMRKVLRQLSHIQGEIDCGIAVIHHYSKAAEGSLTQKLRGSSAIAGWCEWLVGISMADEEAKIRRMEFELKASEPPEAIYYTIESDEQNGRVKLERCERPAPTSQRRGRSALELMQ